MYKVTGKMFTEEQIREKVAELGKQIENDYKGEEILVVGILKGANVFTCDLIRQIMYKVTGKMFTEEQIREKVAELGKQIENDYKGEEILVVGILKGANVFTCDLIRQIDLDVKDRLRC